MLYRMFIKIPQTDVIRDFMAFSAVLSLLRNTDLGNRIDGPFDEKTMDLPMDSNGRILVLGLFVV